MSKTMTSTRQSLIQLTESIHLKDVISFQLNTEFLNQNFQIVKECLLKVQQIQNEIIQQKSQKDNLNKMFSSLESRIKKNQTSIQQHDTKIKELQNNIGDDFMKKLYEIESKTKNTYDFDETVKKIQKMNLFVQKDQLIQQNNHINDLSAQISALKNQLNRYVENTTFDRFKSQFSLETNEIKNQINKLLQNNQLIDKTILNISKQSQKVSQQVEQNSRMIKQMNFAQLMDKIKKFKEDSDQKIGELSIKIKKKCTLNDLNDLQNNLIQKLDKILSANEKGKASLNQTKEALIYLERRVNEIIQVLNTKDNKQENDALFSAKKIHCASCTKDLGKFQGKLGQFRPWAVFPCKQLDPQKAGGLGYLTYMDKIHYRRGSVPDESSLERLNKTFNEKSKQEESPRKVNTARTTNFMSSYGEEIKHTFSLKDEYFKESKNDKAVGNKFFRVKKESMKPSTALESVREKLKQV